MTEAERQAYLRFMWDPKNSHNCEECPENSNSRPLPCGQQNCWVDCHTLAGKESGVDCHTLAGREGDES